jgi:hypothetical protein
MSKSIALLLALVFLTDSCIIVIKSVWAVPEDSWTQMTPMHEVRGRLGVAVVNGKIYAIGGDIGSVGGLVENYKLIGTSAVVSTNEEYDPATDTWVFKSSMPTPRKNFGIAVYQNNIYCIGGEIRNGSTMSYTGVNEVYDPATDTWETKTPMPTHRRFLTANVVNGKIYLIGALDNNSQNQVYDPSTDSWTTKTPPPYEITSCASAVVDNKIYFIGTRTNSSGLWTGAFVQIYNPVNDTWSTGGYSPTYGVSATAGVTSGVSAPKRIYFLDETGNYVYDPANDSWTVGASMPTARGYVGVTVVNDTLYAVGGVILPASGFGEMSPSAVNEQYTPIGYIPEFPTFLILPLFMIATLMTVAATVAAIKKKTFRPTSKRARPY